MSVKTLNVVPIFSAPAPASKRLTYSIAPSETAVPAQESSSLPAELEVFLEHENPLGCIRGVFWVMAFNAIVFLTAFSAWELFRHLW